MHVQFVLFWSGGIPAQRMHTCIFAGIPSVPTNIPEYVSLYLDMVIRTSVLSSCVIFLYKNQATIDSKSCNQPYIS